MRRVKTLLSALLLLSSVTAQSSPNTDSSSKKKLVGSKECVALQYCNKQNAINAVKDEFNIAEQEASNTVQKLFNSMPDRRCSCHDTCVFFGTCCQDYNMAVPEYLDHLRKMLVSDEASYRCDAFNKTDVVVVQKCPPDYPRAIADLCTKEQTGEEKYLKLKVTSSESKITYRNLYCGLCNGEKYSSLKAWRWRFNCFKLNEQFNGTKLNTRDNGTPTTLNDLVGESQCSPVDDQSEPPSNLDIFQNISVYLDNLNLCSNPPVKTCPEGSSGSLIQGCINGANSYLIYNGNKIYKNKDCLLCNEKLSESALESATGESAICESCEHEDKNCEHPKPQKKGFSGSFGVLVQPYHSDDRLQCVTQKDKDAQKCKDIESKLSRCGNGQFLNRNTLKCESICPPTAYFQNDACHFTSAQCTKDTYVNYKDFSTKDVGSNASHILKGKTYSVIADGELSCYNCTNLIQSSATSGLQVSPERLFVYNGKTIAKSFVYRQNNVSWFVCLDQSHVVEEVVSQVLLSISLVSLVLYFCAFFLMKRLRNVPGKIVAGNMVSLFLAYVFFLLRPAVEEYSVGCTVIAVLIHYFLLASFVFNIIYASFIVHSLEFIDFESSVNHWTAIRMWILGLFIPFLFIAPALGVDSLADNEYRPDYGGAECFIMNDNGRLLFFIGPIGLLLLIALILYLIILIKLVQIAKATSQVRSNHKEKIAIAMKLVVVLGFNWMFAVAAAFGRHPILTTVFIVTCTLQGFFGFIVFICNKATARDVRKMLGIKVVTTTSSGGTGTSKNPTMTTDLTKNLLKKKDSPVL